jgi:hypothetical protein
LFAPAHLGWPARTTANTSGVVLGSLVLEAIGAGSIAQASVGLAAVLGAIGLALALGRDGPVARRVGPCSRRPQWSARLALLGAVAFAAPWAASAPVGALLAGASAGVLARELRKIAPAELAISFAVGAGTAFLAQGSERAAMVLPVAALAASALASLAATLRGGPGRPPARPLDALALALVTAAIAGALSLR